MYMVQEIFFQYIFTFQIMFEIALHLDQDKIDHYKIYIYKQIVILIN